ncbi:lipase family alpha/beta hydrolase [Burkholderia gladioli]|uniref:lipase family alpha/beta hydrolase n=1 Tax=Burkholderia gladioli TaxID=28095 RepID=UPI001FC8D93A|nr:GPI inositol-deacylase [Burkholderia gladioli]
MTDKDADFSGVQGDAVVFHGQPEPGGGSAAKVTLTPDADTRKKEVHVDPRPSIPVIFIPGVMGSLLINKNTGEDLWNPPNSKSAGIGFAWHGYWSNAAERQTQYDAEAAMVSVFGEIRTAGCSLTESEARRRGWGSIHADSYHSSLAWLEQELNNPMKGGKLLGAWLSGDPNGEEFALKPLIGTAASAYGAYGSATDAIQEKSDEFVKFCQYRYPVYAMGYNWLQSNLESAKNAVDGLDSVNPLTKAKARLMGVREICAENKVQKAIIITHSMGGLVARMAAVIGGFSDLFYGVIHGAQPATGAPLAARRFRTGAQGEGAFINKVLVGRDSKEFTAITANSVGPLELLPMPDYHNYDPWWVFRDAKRQEILKLPKGGDTFSLYASQAWYGLVPDQSASVLDPAGITAQRLSKSDPKLTVTANFVKTIKGVVIRQSQLVNKYHGNTFAFYGDGPLDPEMQVVQTKDGARRAPVKMERTESYQNLLTFGRVYWTGDFPAGTTEADLLAATLQSDDFGGSIRISVKGKVVTVEAETMTTQFAEQRGFIVGDGTVPGWSGESVARGLKSDVAGGKADGVRVAFDQKGFDHQGCFKHPWARWATLYSMVKIAQSIDVPT